MRRDWDVRALRDARFYIASATADADGFWRSGEEELTALVLSDVELEPDAATVEIGCGIGRLLRPLARHSASVLGVDISPNMVAEARRACADLKNVRVEVTSGTLEMVEDRSRDFIFSYIVFQHIPDAAAIEAYVREAARTLRPGGVFHFQVDGRVRRRGRYLPSTYEGITLDASDVSRMAGAAGLEVVRQWGAGTHYLWTTAHARGDAARLRIVPRVRDMFELRALERRLTKATGVPAHLADENGIRHSLEPFLRMHGDDGSAAFVGAAFRVLLAREALPGELEFNGSILERGLETPADWIDTLVTSGELRSRLSPSVPRLAASAEERLRERLALPAGASLADLMEAVAEGLRNQDPDETVRRAYRAVLGREAEAEGQRYFVGKLALGHFTVMKIVTELMTSEELRTGTVPAS